jgi:hypothetical protein
VLGLALDFDKVWITKIPHQNLSRGFGIDSRGRIYPSNPLGLAARYARGNSTAFHCYPFL